MKRKYKVDPVPSTNFGLKQIAAAMYAVANELAEMNAGRAVEGELFEMGVSKDPMQPRMHMYACLKCGCVSDWRQNLRGIWHCNCCGTIKEKQP